MTKNTSSQLDGNKLDPKDRKPRRLDDIELTADLTEEQVLALWGQPDGSRGSGVDYKAYILEDGQELWLVYSLEPPYRIHGAVLFSPSRHEHKLLYPKSNGRNRSPAMRP